MNPHSIINVNYLNPILDSVANVLETMSSLEVFPGEPSIKQSPRAEGDISGIIAMHNAHRSGSMALSFDKKVIIGITQHIFGEPIEHIDETVCDLVGELTNMCCGGAKIKLSENGYEFDMATPTILTGNGHQIIHPAKAPSIILPLQVELGEIYIEICIEPVEAMASA